MHLHKPDWLLPGLSLLLDPRELSNRIRDWMGPGQLTISNVRYKPGTSCVVTYKLKGAAGANWLHAKAFARDDWPVRRTKIGDRAFIDDELSLAVFNFPLDAELPGLTEFAANPESFLSRVLFEHSANQPFHDFEVLAYKPNRRFVAGLNSVHGNRLVLKLHDSSTFQSALKSAAILKNLPFHGAPRRVGRSTRHQALAYDWIPGKSLDFAKMDAALRQQTTEMLIDYLRELQRTVDARRSRMTIRRPAEGIREIAAFLGAICGPLSAKVESIARDLLTNEPVEFAPAFVHGDFHERQLIFQPNNISVCDFDNCGFSDTTVDLANFLAHLNYRVCMNELPVESAANAIDQCLRHVDQSEGRNAHRRFQWNQAAGLFRLATHPFRCGSENWIEQTETLLQQVRDRIRSSNRYELRPTFEAEPLWQAIEADVKFDFLSGVFDEGTATRVLQQSLPGLKRRFGEFAVERVIPKRHKPGRRCLIEFELATKHGLRSILGKVSAKRTDSKAMKIQHHLYKQHHFDDASHDRVSVPRPLGRCARWQMWLQKKVDGVSGGELLEKKLLGQFSDRIASAITKLHDSSFQPKRIHSIDDELKILNDRLLAIMMKLPVEAHRIERVLKKCNAIGRRLSNQCAVPIHRDFYQDQVMFGGDQTFLVDLDLVSLGHPALDIGNFAAHLVEHGIRIHGDANHWMDEEEQLVRNYLAGNPNCTASEIDSFKVISFARHIFISGSMANRQHVTSRILAVAEQLTAGFS